MKNKFGLSRDIPSDIKRSVRQRCGFGCVICGGAVFDYEHFSPEFANARQHIADGITLLCPTCHAKKTRNLLSDRRVREANSAPAAREMRYAYSDLEGTPLRPFINFAGMTLKNCITPLQIGNFPVLKIEDAEVKGGPYRLSATFFNSHGQPSLFIRQNEWQVLADTWDVEVVGPSITVRTEPGQIALRLVLHAGEGLAVERLEMKCAGYRLSGNADELKIYPPDGGHFTIRGGLVDNCPIGLSLG